MRNFKIAFFDIDGTLADNRLIQQSKVFDRIPKSAKETLKQLKRHTIEPVIASGRNFETIRPLAEALGVESVVSSNGQYVTYKGEEVYKKTLPEDTVKALIEELREKGQEFLMEAAHHVYQFDGEKFKGDGTLTVTFIPRDTIPDDVLQFITVEPMGDDRYHEDIEGLVATRVAPHILNIHTEGFDKGKGITHLLEEMKIDKKFAIAFGDEENDESMFDAVGFTVAMGNGNPVLRDQADYVTSSVHKDGIYKAAKHLGLF